MEGLGGGSREGGEGGEYPLGMKAFKKPHTNLFCFIDPVLKVQSLESIVLSTMCRVSIPESGVQSLEPRVQSSESRVQSQ